MANAAAQLGAHREAEELAARQLFERARAQEAAEAASLEREVIARADDAPAPSNIPCLAEHAMRRACMQLALETTEAGQEAVRLAAKERAAEAAAQVATSALDALLDRSMAIALKAEARRAEQASPPLLHLPSSSPPLAIPHHLLVRPPPPHPPFAPRAEQAIARQAADELRVARELAEAVGAKHLAALERLEARLASDDYSRRRNAWRELQRQRILIESDGQWAEQQLEVRPSPPIPPLASPRTLFCGRAARGAARCRADAARAHPSLPGHAAQLSERAALFLPQALDEQSLAAEGQLEALEHLQQRHLRDFHASQQAGGGRHRLSPPQRQPSPGEGIPQSADWSGPLDTSPPAYWAASPSPPQQQWWQQPQPPPPQQRSHSSSPGMRRRRAAPTELPSVPGVGTAVQLVGCGYAGCRIVAVYPDGTYDVKVPGLGVKSRVPHGDLRLRDGLGRLPVAA